jgi:luciferase family oxidoreductase group 1
MQSWHPADVAGPGLKGVLVRIRLSILDLAPIRRGESPTDSFAASVAMAQRAEQLGYHRVWYAEHHNMATIASSATSVLIAHVGAHTSTIRLGAGGVMLPNHAPLLIAEQFGTLAAMYPDRIDLGLGRAPGSDQNTMYALRRDPSSAEDFPRDVVELQGYLTGHSRVPGVNAIPGKGSNVPLFILGSSLFGAKLAAALGLPYAFASHFAPDALEAAISTYRAGFRASAQLDRPYVIAGVNTIVAETTAAARDQLQSIRRLRAISLYGRQFGASELDLSDEQADQILAAGAAAHVDQMLTYTAAGTPGEVAEYLDGFRTLTAADELITVHQANTGEARLRSVTLLAEALPAAA